MLTVIMRSGCGDGRVGGVGVPHTFNVEPNLSSYTIGLRLRAGVIRKVARSEGRGASKVGFVGKQFLAKSELCSIAISRQISGSSQVPAKSRHYARMERAQKMAPDDGPFGNSTVDSVRLREGSTIEVDTSRIY